MTKKAPPRKGRRPVALGGHTRCTAKAIAQYAEVIREGGSLRDAAASIGVDVATARNWRDRAKLGTPCYVAFRRATDDALLDLSRRLRRTLGLLAEPHDEVKVKGGEYHPASRTDDGVTIPAKIVGGEVEIKQRVVHFGALKLCLDRADRMLADEQEPAEETDAEDVVVQVLGRQKRRLLAELEHPSTNAAARASLTRQLGVVELALAEATRPEENNPEDLPDEEYVADLERAGREEMPEHHVQAVLRGWASKHGRSADAVVAALVAAPAAVRDDEPEPEATEHR